MFDAGQHSRHFPGSAIDDRKGTFGMDVGKGWDYGLQPIHPSMGSPVALGRIQITEGHTLTADAGIDLACAVAGKKAVGRNVLVKERS
jgi:hypothetical protein